MYDILVVGSGFSGSIMARRFAEEHGFSVLLLEQRSHIGGNMYDERNEHGILVQKYGPHFINTDRYWIIEYLSCYSELVEHTTKLLSFIDGNYVQLPFNFKTLQQLVTPAKSELLLKKMRTCFAGRDRVPIFELVEHSDTDIRDYGELLFNKAYKTYVAKQWGMSPSKIDKSVLNRVPMAMNYDERYLNKDFQYLPKDGFTKLFENILNHPNITVRLNCNALKKLTFDEVSHTVRYDREDFKQVIFTGAIDELFNQCFGALPYRSLDIHYNTEKCESLIPGEIVSYPQAKGYTRRTEYKKLNYPPLHTEYTTVATEYPLDYDRDAKIGNQPYYPVNTQDSDCIYKKYLQKSLYYKNLFLCGRLAEYKYYNMDAVIESTFEKYQKLEQILGL